MRRAKWERDVVCMLKRRLGVFFLFCFLCWYSGRVVFFFFFFFFFCQYRGVRVNPYGARKRKVLLLSILINIVVFLQENNCANLAPFQQILYPFFIFDNVYLDAWHASTYHTFARTHVVRNNEKIHRPEAETKRKFTGKKPNPVLGGWNGRLFRRNWIWPTKISRDSLYVECF